jgi:NitT/TauT family transport system permease protein
MLGVFNQAWLIRVVSVVVVLGSWELYARSLASSMFLASPTAIVTAATELFVNAKYWSDLQMTMTGMVLGYLVACVIGTAIGFLMGRYRTFALALDPYVMILYATPRIALIPLLILFFGIDLQLRVVTVALSSVFPILINTYNGVRNVDADLIETATAFNANERQMLRTIIIPGTFPFVFAGLQIGLGQAIVAIIVAEMTVAVSGLGGRIIQYSNSFEIPDMFVAILSTSILSLVLVNGLRAMERPVMPYRFLGSTTESWRRRFTRMWGHG